VEASSGNEALRLMLGRRFSVVLLDVQMPDMDGFEAAELMRSHVALAHTPIIFVTAINKDDRHVYQGYASGAVDYIFKPINPDILRSKVRVFLELHQAALDRRRLEEEREATRNLESLGILAAGIAHDFNNLLTVILANISVAQQSGALGADEEGALADAMGACRTAHRLAQELRTLFPGGPLKLEPTPVSELVQEGLARLAEDVAPPLDLEVPANLPSVPVNAEQIRRVFESLALNAHEAMPSGGRLAVRAALVGKRDALPAALAAGTYVRVCFADTGVGIAAEDLPRIFDPYFTTKKMGSRKGAGLGLAICQAIVRKHGGTITAQSEKGRGTEVCVFLAVAPPEAPDRALPGRAGRAS
jgi:signal transduction histidine kinase